MQPVNLVLLIVKFSGVKLHEHKVDDIDTPVNIDIRPGKYNAEQLATEVTRAINPNLVMIENFKSYKTWMIL